MASFLKVCGSELEILKYLREQRWEVSRKHCPDVAIVLEGGESVMFAYCQVDF